MGKPNASDVRLSKRLGNNLATYRKATKHTQKSLGQVIGLDKETISRMERGVALPSLYTLEKLGDELKVPLTALIGESAVPADKLTLSVANRIDENTTQADTMALLFAKWLGELDEKNRTYVCAVVKDLCRHLRQYSTPSERRRKETRPWSARNPDPQGGKS